MVFKDLEKALTELVGELAPAAAPPAGADPFKGATTFDRCEKDNARWKVLLSRYLAEAKTFEIHCWKEEAEWIGLALQYGRLKETGWKHGKVITGEVTPQFSGMLLGLPKPADTELENKMTPFFNIFLDDTFQSCHYGTENYYV